MTGPEKRRGGDLPSDAWQSMPDAESSGIGVPAPRRGNVNGGGPPGAAGGDAGTDLPRAAGSDAGADLPGAAGGDADLPGADLEVRRADVAGIDDLAGTVAELTTEDLDDERRGWLLGRLVTEVRRRGVGDVFKPRSAMRWIADALGDVAPRIPVRDLATLREHHDGLEGDALADRLIRNAARVTASIGAASGGVASVEWVVTPTLLTTPVLLAVETVVVVAVEVKLIGELHAVYGQPLPGTLAQRGTVLLQAWAQRRGVNPMVPGVAMNTVLGTAARKELRDRLLRRFSRNITTLGPMLTGAAVAGYLNHRATIALGEHVWRDLADRAGRG